MHETEEKTPNGLVPLGLICAFQSWFRGFQGQRVGDPRPCPNCGETMVWKNGYRTDRLFAILITEDSFEEVTVEIQRYQYSECRYSYDGDISEWFYEDCDYAKPVVDLCLFHAAENPFHGVISLTFEHLGETCRSSQPQSSADGSSGKTPR